MSFDDEDTMENPLAKPDFKAGPSRVPSDFDTADLFKVLQQKAEEAGKSGGPISDCLNFAIHPHHPYRLVWDVCILLLVFYSSIKEPYKAAFMGQHSAWWEILIDVAFYLDIIASFWTGFDMGYDVVMDKGAIVSHYVFGSKGIGWFFIDFVATVDWDKIIALTGDERFADSPLVRMLRLIKVLRLARASRLIHKITAKWTLHSGYIEAFKFFMYVGIVAHILACFFFLWPTLFECPEDKFSDFAYETTAYGAILDDCAVANPDPVEHPSCFIGKAHADTCLQGSWVQAYGLDQFATPMRQYIDSMYWSLTTMTTIGYGDRGPQHMEEIVFVMFAEVFGLAFFALLLTQINNVNDVLGEGSKENNDTKNAVVQFLQTNHVEEELITEAVRYLNFRASALSGNAYNEDDPRFDTLSPSLRKSIQLALYMPVLQDVRIWGWHEKDIAENTGLEKMFVDIDADGGGALDHDEIAKLLSGLGLKLSAAEVDHCFVEMGGSMDDDADGVDMDEFKNWWHLKKNGLPRINQSPLAFLQSIAVRLRTQAYSLDEEIVSAGSYGEDLVVLLSGEAVVYQHGQTVAVGAASFEDEGGSPDVPTRVVSSKDRENCVGFSACLDADAFMVVARKTQKWVVRTQKGAPLGYVDTLRVARKDLQVAFQQHWLGMHTGQAQLGNFAQYYYAISEADSVLDRDSPVPQLAGGMSERVEALNGLLSQRLDEVQSRFDIKLAQIRALIEA